ncbi:hypothetical protein LTR37_004895 [Vermiconidia calcicola]|uniref:Uncharacterized protein n=1 Tax=Vermiconidia calcicola TaxID=1690605 RepID=A0ACC3NKS6_9PEZI|nr:hypothetical protein LTR37_004895 [Vermiconidia calcicola]
MDPRVPSTSLLQFTSDTVKLIVGSEAKEFIVHSSHLAHTSPVFQAAVKQIWKEGEDQKMTLPEDEPSVVHTYLHFAYSGKVPVRPPTQTRAPARTSMDKKFKNAVIDAVIAKTRVADANGSTWLPSENVINPIYLSTCAGSPIRRLIVDLYFKRGTALLLVHESISKDFMMDLTRKLLDVQDALRQGGDFEWDSLKICNYHEHEAGEICPTTGRCSLLHRKGKWWKRKLRLPALRLVTGKAAVSVKRYIFRSRL